VIKFTKLKFYGKIQEIEENAIVKFINLQKMLNIFVKF